MYEGFFEDQTALVTGGCGFIGSHVAERLTQLGCTVRVLDDCSSGFRRNLDGIDAAVFEGSILDDTALSAAIEGCDLVFHFAAMVSVQQSMEHPRSCFDINLTGTRRVLEAAVGAACNRVVFAASSSAYGPHAPTPSREDLPTNPTTPYAASKVAAEAMVSAWAHCYAPDTVSLRFFNVFGPRQDPHSPYAAVIAAFAEALQSGNSPVIHGDGTQSRDFVPIEDVVHACLLAAASRAPLGGRVLNIGTGLPHDLLSTLATMQEILETTAQPRFEPPRLGDIQHSLADIGAAQTSLGYEPLVSFEEGLSRLLTGRAGLPA
ncbi:MAG: SDR family NAD(P)-dependent oxidoreductase [Phycisphaerales bacterium]|jgi:UDP-glucose 4-epimerase|nr:SDR family NAD(P)-dependent oxidoreductase [Phycisphaerales bacterium]